MGSSAVFHNRKMIFVGPIEENLRKINVFCQSDLTLLSGINTLNQNLAMELESLITADLYQVGKTQIQKTSI